MRQVNDYLDDVDAEEKYEKHLRDAIANAEAETRTRVVNRINEIIEHASEAVVRFENGLKEKQGNADELQSNLDKQKIVLRVLNKVLAEYNERRIT